MVVTDGRSLPIGFLVTSASPAEVKLAPRTVKTIPLKDLPAYLIGDKAYDSDGLAAQLMKNHWIELIAPNRSNRKVKTQDGRRLRRYRNRWKVERFFAWMGGWRRTQMRWERHLHNYTAFLMLACCMILLRRFVG